MRFGLFIGVLAALALGGIARADDEDHWELLPPKVTSATLAAEHATKLASAGFEKIDGRRQTVTYWAKEGRNYRCVDLEDIDHVRVDAYCYREKRIK